MSITQAKLPSLKKKLEEKEMLEKELDKVDDKIDEIVGETKVKITKKNKK